MARTSTLIYGSSGTGKTSLLYSFMKWLRSKEPNAVARLVSAENWSTIQDAIDEGWIEAWNVNRWSQPFQTLRLAAMGYWPEDVNDPASKLNPPTPETFSRVHAYMFEGLSTFGDFMLEGYAPGGLADRAARGEDIKAREDSARFKDGEAAVGGNARTDYSIVQKEVHGLVVQSHDLPCHLIWTAHQTDAVDDRGRPIIGPEIVGEAATKRVPRWFANVLHTTAPGVRKGALVETEYKVFTRIHYDPEATNLNVPYIAKNQSRRTTIVPFLQETTELHREDLMGHFMSLIEKPCGIPEQEAYFSRKQQPFQPRQVTKQATK